MSTVQNLSPQLRPSKFKGFIKKFGIFFLFVFSAFRNLLLKLSKKENIQQDIKEEVQKKKWPTFSQIKYLPKFLSIKERIIIGAATAVIIICVIFIGILFYQDNFINKPAGGGAYTEGVIGYPQKINPLYASTNEVDRDLTSLIFAGLIKFDDNQNIVADLAQDWFIDDTETKYTFRLRDDIKWPDEKPFTSEDVIFTFTAIQDADYQSPLKSTWEEVEIKALDEYTVQFILPEPFVLFLENLGLGILPAHLWQDVKPENALLAELNLEPIGLGAFQFDSYTKDKQGQIKLYNLVRNENYHLNVPFIKQIIFKFYPNFEMGVEALSSRNIDGLNFLPQSLKEFLESRKDLNYYYPSLPQYTAIFFNQDNNDLLKNKNFRKALQLSIDKDKMISNVLDGQAKAIEGPILPGYPGYSDESEKSEFKVEEAKKILADLGWKKKEILEEGEINTEVEQENSTSTDEFLPEMDADGMSKYLFKADRELIITLTLANQAQSISVAELIQKYWQAIGVRVDLNIIESNQIQKDVITPRNYEALLFGEILGVDPDPYAFWHSSQSDDGGLNLANFKNKEADNLLEKARKEVDENKRAEHYSKFQDILIKEIPAIFLYNPNYTYVVSNKVKGINLIHIITPTDRLSGIANWYIKTRKGLK